MTKEEMQAMAGLHKKLAAVMAAISTVEKRGRNQAQGYDYAKAEDILREVRPLLAVNGLSFCPAVVAAEHSRVESGAGRWQNVVILTLSYTLTDTDTGAQMVVPWTGVGQDSGDKALYKAFTGALKYFWLETLLIPTGDDPEEDGAGDQGPGPKRQAPPRPPAPARPAGAFANGESRAAKMLGLAGGGGATAQPAAAPDPRHTPDAFWGEDKKRPGTYRTRAQWEAWLRGQNPSLTDQQIAVLKDEVLRKVVKEGFARKEKEKEGMAS